MHMVYSWRNTMLMATPMKCVPCGGTPFMRSLIDFGFIYKSYLHCVKPPIQNNLI